MAEITCLSHLVIRSNKFDEWVDYATNILGMQLGGRTNDTLHFRMDDHQYRLVIEAGPEEDIAVAGWELDNEDDLEAYVEHVRSTGVRVEEGSEALRRKRQVERIYTCEDPLGFNHEFITGPRLLQEPFRSKVLVGAFRTGELGLGHFVPVSPDVDAAQRFYQKSLKLGLSGYMRPTEDLKVVFFHTRTGRFHSLATANLPMPKKLFHIGLEVTGIDDVGRAYDRAAKGGVRIASTIGHHPNARSVSFYMECPSGFQFEILSDEIIIDRDHWQVSTYTATSDWGHAPLN